MSKEKLGLLEKIDNIMSQPVGPVGLAVSIAIMGLLVYGMDTISDSENKLSGIRSNNLATPSTSEQCIVGDPFDRMCYYQITQEKCDGNNTLSRADDICEVIEYWAYAEPIPYPY